jgi:hypothetical protein
MKAREGELILSSYMDDQERRYKEYCERKQNKNEKALSFQHWVSRCSSVAKAQEVVKDDHKYLIL